MKWWLIECSHWDEILIHSIKRHFWINTKNYMHWWDSLNKIYQNFNFNIWWMHLCSPSCICMSLFFIVRKQCVNFYVVECCCCCCHQRTLTTDYNLQHMHKFDPVFCHSQYCFFHTTTEYTLLFVYINYIVPLLKFISFKFIQQWASAHTHTHTHSPCATYERNSK